MILLKKASVLIIIFIVLLLGACNQAKSNVYYAMIVVANNKEYNGSETVWDDNIKIGEMLGEVEKKTPADVMPENNQSNYFKVGSKIYSVKGTDQFIIVRDNENREHLLERAPRDEESP
ncbi:hypothetical protein [Niallia sp. Man26]|uniref:hypothetical protein n=1 Tax=Niallia sp. Man26 TaxID=2912824 RepID=UPI00206ECC5E|nr:hypothetical protein [Niallia sp. Man26]UPO90556.1 hypothetical protein L8T27_021130 [Niallia sp. Man26]